MVTVLRGSVDWCWLDTAGESFVVETGEECRRGIGKQVPLENQILLKDTMQEQIDQVCSVGILKLPSGP